MVKILGTQFRMFERNLHLFGCGISPSDRLDQQNSPLMRWHVEIQGQRDDIYSLSVNIGEAVSRFHFRNATIRL